MFQLDKFIASSITRRGTSLFEDDIRNNEGFLRDEIEGKSACVIGGAGSIGSSFIKSMLRFRPGSLMDSTFRKTIAPTR